MSTTLEAQSPARTRRSSWALVSAPLLAVLVAVGLLGLIGELDTPILGDPGALVRYGLPAATALSHTAAALTVGLLLTSVVLLDGNGDALTPLRARVTRWAGWGAGAWSALLAVTLFLGSSELFGEPLGSPTWSGDLVLYVTEVPAASSLVLSVVLALAAAAVAVTARSGNVALLAGVLALATLPPQALAGHASGASSIVIAITTLAAHLLGAALWAGGVGALLLTGRMMADDQLKTAVRRFSTLAGVCFLVVAATGVIGVWLHLGSWSVLGSEYGVLALAKTAALLVLGGLGWLHRRSVIRAMDSADHVRALFWRLLGVEVVVMAITFGLAVALSRSAAPL